MTSQIVRTNPTAGTATTSSVRNNFGFAADEINQLLRANTDKVVATGTDSVVANFSNVPTFVLADGVRVLIEIANTTTSATPTLNVNNSNAKSIKKSDGSSLAIGDLVAGGYYEFVYDLGEDEWKVMSLSASVDETAIYEAVLAGLYPIGSLLTTTLSSNPGVADYFFSGTTFGTWESYAQGRTLVGIDTGFGITLFSASSNNSKVTLVISERAIGEGDSITVSGFTTPANNANGSFVVISSATAAGQTTITYDATITDQASLPSANFNLINESFDTVEEIGGETTHELTVAEIPAADATLFVNSGQASYDRLASTSLVESHNNMQPYIVTYIWKRTA
jgi:hypothetical protein